MSGGSCVFVKSVSFQARAGKTEDAGEMSCFLVENEKFEGNKILITKQYSPAETKKQMLFCKKMEKSFPR